MRVQILFITWSSIYDQIKDSLASFLESRTWHAILFMDVVAVPTLWKSMSPAVFLLRVMFILHVLY